nr:MAG TPA: portal [Caudoviricetes sp.]
MKNDKNTSTKKGRITAGGNFPLSGQTTPNTIILRQPRRFNIDISDYTGAVHAAEDVDFSRRYKLYDLYSDILMDPHLSSVIDRRISAVASADISFLKDGKTDTDIAQQLDSPWFVSLIRDILEARFWGFSLMQFYKQDGWVNYDLIPRKHVDPVRRIILRRQTDLTGTSWEEYPNLLPVGRKNDLGLLAKAAPWVIYKRNDVADWAQYAEIFGTPIREYIYETDDDDSRMRAVRDAEQEGSLAAFIHAHDTELHLVESGNKSASADLYEKLCQRCNNELSKLILGNTLTTESQANGTQSLGTVHKKEEDKLLRDDQKFVLNILNYEITDIFQAMGIDTRGGKFVFVDPKYTDLQSKVNIISQLHNTFALPVSDDYLYEEFGIDKPADYDTQKIQAEKNKQKKEEPTRPVEQERIEKAEEEKEKNSRKRTFFSALRSFFARAPHDGAHLDW